MAVDPQERDLRMMRLALEQAELARARDEVPVGAIVALGDRVITAAHNERELTRDPTAHAELLAMRRAARLLGEWRLEGVTVYVTLEPCAMCAGTLVNARVPTLVYGAPDPKAGAVRSLFRIADDPRLNHRLEIRSGLLEQECSELLRSYFRAKRAPRP